MSRHSASHPARRQLVAVALLAALILPLTEATASEEIRIVRDRFGVPHVYGPTAEAVSYGAGYALAQDRLWQMHFLGLVAQGRLSKLLGPLTVAGDRTVRFWTYTKDERARRFATYPEDIQDNIRAFADGINAWIAQIRLDPTKLPFEFTEFGEPLEDWTVDESIALADYLIYTFGSGGGSEITNLAVYQQLVQKFGLVQGKKAFDDLVWVNDPDAPLSIPADYDWHNSPTHAREEADDKALTPDARISLPDDQKIVGSALSSSLEADPLRDLPLITEKVITEFEALENGRKQLERFIKFGSNAQIVAPSRSDTGNSLQQAGPQVGYFLPQALTDFGLHSADGKLDATGMTFAGAGPAVLIGRGKGYAWTTTTGASDLTDTFVETLNPADSKQYLFNGNWERMECRTEVHRIKGIGFENQEICRTRHGPVVSFDLANNKAYALRYAWFNKEGGTVEGFFRYNQAKSLEDFATYSNLLASNHNMFYSDDQGNIGYWHPGMFPRRPSGVDLRFPLDGTGSQEWTGVLTAQEVPHAVNLPRGWLANWNNKPSIDWNRENGWGAVHGVVVFDHNLDASAPPRPDPFGGLINQDRSVSWQDLNANIRYAAFRDFNADFFSQYLPTSSSNSVQAAALDVLSDYNGFIYDSNADGMVDSAGYTILGRFTTELRSAIFNDDLGSSLLGRSSASTVVHVMNASAGLAPQFNWLGTETREQIAARVFSKVVTDLAAQFGNNSPATWRSAQPEQKYTRTNADLFTDQARTAAGRKPGSDPFPGNVPNHIRMNRGTYNHLVAYLDPPSGSGSLGASRVDAGSVISPGQNGFMDALGREGPHYRDQFDLYVQWRYKPMPMTLTEARLVAESETVITR